MPAPHWEVEKIGELKGHTGGIYAMAHGRGSNSIFTASGDGFLAEWDLETFEPSPFSIKAEAPLFSVLHIPDYNQVLIGTSQGAFHIIDLENHKELRKIAIHKKGVFHLNYHPTKKHVYSLGGNGSLGIWQWPDQTLIKQITIGYGKLRQLAISPDGGMIAVSCQDGYIRIFETDSYEELYSFYAHDGGAHALLFHPSIGLLFSGGKDAHLRSWKVNDGFKKEQDIPAHNYGIYGLTLSPDQSMLASVSRDANVKLWSGTSPDMPLRISRPTFKAHTHSVNTALWLDDARLVTSGDDRRIITWKISKVNTLSKG